MGHTQMRRSRRALAAATMIGMVGGSLATMGTANAAVMLSGSLVDSAGNYAEGVVYAYTTTGAQAGSDFTYNGAFDIPLADGTYKLEFNSFGDFKDEWYRDKADEATADVVTVAGAGQTLAPWTVDRVPSVTGVVRSAAGNPVADASIVAYDAATNLQVETATADINGAFQLGTTAPTVKLRFSGYDRVAGESLATEFYNDKATLATADVVAPTAAGASVGVVTLVPGGSIAGRITSESGAPLHRAQACLESSSNCDETDANGYYLIDGVNTGNAVVRFSDPIGEYVGEYYNNVADVDDATPVAVAPGQAVANIDAALAARPVVAPNGVDVSGTVRDELGGIGVGYVIKAYGTPADPDNDAPLAQTVSNRTGQYNFTELDRIGGETEFKIVVEGEGPREDGDFARRTTWSGDKLGYETATVITPAPRVLDFTLPVAGGISGAVTSEAGGAAQGGYASFRNSDELFTTSASTEADGTYDNRSLWAGDYTVLFGATLHVSEWWKDALPEDATAVTVKPGQMTTGISAALSKDVKAIERPEVKGNAWVGKTISLDAGRWNTQAASRITYEWLAGTTVVATGPTLKVTKSLLGKKLTGRVTNDAGFAQGQAITKTTPKVGYQPKLKANVKAKSAAITLKVKPLKAKKVKATVKVFEIVGVKKNGDDKLKSLGKGKITRGSGVVRFKKALGKGKHKLVFSVKGKGKVGSGDIRKTVKLKR